MIINLCRRVKVDDVMTCANLCVVISMECGEKGSDIGP